MSANVPQKNNTVADKPTMDGEILAFYTKCLALSIILVASLWTAKPLLSRDYAEFRTRIPAWMALPVTFGISYIQGKSFNFCAWATKRVMGVSAIKQMIEATGLPLFYFEVLLPGLFALLVSCGLMLWYFLWLSRTISRRGSQTRAGQEQALFATEKVVA